MGRSFRVGSLEVSTERVPHDAPQVAVRVASANHAIGYAVDVGRVTAPLTTLLASCDVALVEANHCSEMLAFGPYPTHLRHRVSGGLGHLSNTQTAELAQKLVGSRLGRLYLGHLSRSNNTPERALEVVASAARRMIVVGPAARRRQRARRPPLEGVPAGAPFRLSAPALYRF